MQTPRGRWMLCDSLPPSSCRLPLWPLLTFALQSGERSSARSGGNTSSSAFPAGARGIQAGRVHIALRPRGNICLQLAGRRPDASLRSQLRARERPALHSAGISQRVELEKHAHPVMPSPFASRLAAPMCFVRSRSGQDGARARLAESHDESP